MAKTEISPADILDALGDGEQFEAALIVAPGTESSGDAAAQAEPATRTVEDPRARWTRKELEDLGFSDDEIGALVAGGCVKDELNADGAEKPWWLAPTTLEHAAKIVRRVQQMEDEKKALAKQFARRTELLETKIAVYKEQAYPECIRIIEARLPRKLDGTFKKKNIDHELLRLQLKTYSEKVSLVDPAALVTYMETLEANLRNLREEIAALGSVEPKSDLQALELEALEERQTELVNELRVLVDAFRLTVVSREHFADEEAWQIVGKYPQPGANEAYEKSFDEAAVVAYVKNHEPLLAFDNDLETGEVKEIKVPFTLPGIKREEGRTELYPA